MHESLVSFFSPLKTEIRGGWGCADVGRRWWWWYLSYRGMWHSDNETHGKVTANVTQIKLGISILIFWLPSDLQWIIMFKSPPPHRLPSVSHCCFILFLPVIHPAVAHLPLPELLIYRHPPPSNTTTTDSVAGKRHCERVLYPKSSLVLNR